MVYCMLLVALTVSAETIRTLDGEVYSGATVTRQDEYGVSIKYSRGICRIAYTNLPQSIRDKYIFNAPAPVVMTNRQAVACVTRGRDEDRLTQALRVLSTAPVRHVDAGSAKTSISPSNSMSSAGRYSRNYASSSRSSGNYATARVQVKGYYRKDGTYVRSHSRSRPRR